MEDFNIAGESYRNNTLERKVVESLSISRIKPTLNTREICATKVI